MSNLSQIKVSAFYVAVFNRAPDHQGLNYWLNQIQGLGEGATYSTLASQFAQHPVFAETYSSLTDVGFVESLYTNILGQAGDSNGVAYWVNKLSGSVGMTRVQVLTQFVQDAVSVDLTTGAAAWGLTQEEWEVAVARQNYLFNKAEVGIEFASRLVADSNMSPDTVTTTLAGLMEDPAYVASIDILKGVTNESSTLVRAKDLIQQAVSQDDPVAYITANASDAPTGPIYYLTEGADQFPAGFGGDNGGNDHIYGSNDPLTFNTSDVIDGGYGYDTLTLDLVAQAARVNSGFVADVERLDINAFEGEDSVTLQMTRFDDQLEQINIRGAQDDVSLLDQQSVAAVRLVDTSNDLNLDYDSQLVLGDADHLNLAIDEVASTITVGAGIESVTVDVEDGRNESSTLSLVASTVGEIVVEGGLSDQRATLNVELGAVGGSLDATGFAGDITVTSADLGIVETGAGDDIVTVSGWQDNAWAVADLGNGDNVLNITANAAGSVVVGTGTDDVNITGDFNGTAVLGSSSAEVGSNTMDVSGILRGSITGTSGVDTVAVVGITEATGSVNLLNGSNAFTSGQAFGGTYTGGINNDVVTITTGGLTADGEVNLGSASSEVGSNTLTVGASAAIAGTVNGSSGADTVTATGSTVSGSVDLRNGTNILGAASITGTYTGGTGNDTVTLTGTVDGTGALVGTVSLGAGTNALSAANLTQATVTGLGGVDTVTVTGVVSGGSVNTGSGADQISIGTDLSSSTTVTGDAEIRTEDGADTVTIKGDIAGGALIDLGANGDTLNLTGSATNMPTVSGSTLLTEINMGSGADTLVITGSNTVSSDALIQSGASVSAGSAETGDVLTVQSVDDVTLIQRTAAQSLTIDFAKTDSSNYAVGDVVSVTVAGTTYSYTVLDEDVVQGNGVATSRNVAEGLDAALPGTFTLAGGTSSTFTYLGTVGDADKVITAAVNSTAVTPTVVQIANTSISGFETLNLTALNAISATDGEGNTADISVDIALTSGITNINLANQEDLVAVTTGAGTSAYVTNSAGDANVFSLTNLNGNELVTIVANEASATGNYQVNTVTIDDAVAAHQIGDVISVTIGDVVVAITVEEDDLTPGGSAATDANLIANKLADAINAAEVPLDAFVANNVVTLKGIAGADYVGVSAEHARPATFTVGSGTLSHVDGFDIGTKVLVLDRDQTVGGTEDITYNIDGTTLVPGYDTSAAQELPYAVGDIIRVTVGAVTKQYVVTQEALDAYCERGDTALIAQGIAAALNAGPDPVTASAVRGSVAVDSDLTVTYTQIRGIDAVLDNTIAGFEQSDSAIDDRVIDTTILATLSATDTGVDTFQLTVNGNEDYDIALGSNDADFVAGSKYENLNLTLGGNGDYVIDTFGHGGNYNTAITISGGVVGQNVELYNVLAETITSTSAANLTIDREDLGDSDRLVVTTGSGSDHLITSMGGLLANGASVNLGTGSNTLSIYSGSEGSTIDQPVLGQIGQISFTGNLDRLEILNQVELNSNASLAMMGVEGQVDSIYFNDFGSINPQYDLAISRTASTLTIESNDDFYVNNLTTFGVTDLTVEARDDIDFAVKGVLTNLNVISRTDDVDVRIEDQSGISTRTFGSISLTSGTGSDESNLHIDGLTNDTLNISTISIAGSPRNDDEDADLEIKNLDNATITIGDVSLAGTDADLFLSNSVVNSSVTIGNVSVTSQSDNISDTAAVYVDASDSTIEIASIDITSGAAAKVVLDNNNNVDITVGEVSILAGLSDAQLSISDNVTTTPSDDDQNDGGSVISLGDVDVISCESDAEVDISGNRDLTNEADLRITLGDLLMDAEDDVYLDVRANINTTIEVGNITAHAGTFEGSSDSDISIEIENNSVTEASESNQITVGDISATAYGNDARTELEISSNNELDLTLGHVQLSAYGSNGDVRYHISDSEGDSTITIGEANNGEDPIEDAVVLTATDNVRFDISDNAIDRVGTQGDSMDIDIHGNVDLTAGGDATFYVAGNGYSAGEDSDYFSLVINGDLTVEAGNQTLDDRTSADAEIIITNNDNFVSNVIGDVTVTSTDNTGLKISDNDNGMIVFSDVTVESLTSGAVDADLIIESNTNVMVGMASVVVKSESTDSNAGYALLKVSDNENALMILGEDFFGEDQEPIVSVTANAAKAEIIIADNDGVTIAMGEDFYGEDDSAEILIQSAQSDASLNITENGSDSFDSEYINLVSNGLPVSDASYDAYDLFEDFTVTTNIYLGDVKIDAGNNASLTIDENNGDDADVFIRVGDVEMNADDQATVFIQAENPDNNDATQIVSGPGARTGADDVTYREATRQEIIVGDFDITALGISDDVGPTVDFDASSPYQVTDDWETNRPVNNGENTAYNADWDLLDTINATDYPGTTSVTLGDITINSGGSDSWVEVDLTNILGTERIDISADYLGASDSMIELDAQDTYDLNTVILSGDDSNVYLTGYMGGISDDNGSFLLDMKDMTGGFGGAASAYNPNTQDDGNYIETHAAEFDGTVNVLLGSGDFIYNAAYTTMWSSDADWSGDSGWYSLGEDSDWSPVAEVVTLSGFNRYFGGVSSDSDNDYVNIQFNQGNQSYLIVLDTLGTEPGGGGDDADAVETTWNIYYKQNGLWVDVDTLTPGGPDDTDEQELALLAGLLGAKEVDINFSGYSAEVVITGHDDGTSFTQIEELVVSQDEGSGMAGVGAGSILADSAPDDGYVFPVIITSEAGELALDAIGQNNREVFTFTGDHVGEIVIGGFNPGSFNTFSPENGRETDRLDFSQFDWNGDGSVDSADQFNLSDFDFSIVDEDGFFKDVIVDFHNRDDLGQIRLVGVGEYADAIELVQDSIYFG